MKEIFHTEGTQTTKPSKFAGWVWYDFQTRLWVVLQLEDNKESVTEVKGKLPRQQGAD